MGDLQKNRIKELTEKMSLDFKSKNVDLKTQDLVKKMRKLNEQEEEKKKNRKTIYDQTREEKSFEAFFDDLNVATDFIELEVYDNFIFWGGTVDGIIQFVFKVTPNEDTSGVEFNYLEGFSPENPENDEIIERIESYYNQFYKYWRDNILQT